MKTYNASSALPRPALNLPLEVWRLDGRASCRLAYIGPKIAVDRTRLAVDPADRELLEQDDDAERTLLQA
jgi:hypothetical protein